LRKQGFFIYFASLALHLPLPILNRLRQMRRLDALRPRQIRDGAPDLVQFAELAQLGINATF
jgi:hypothetical protein